MLAQIAPLLDLGGSCRAHKTKISTRGVGAAGDMCITDWIVMARVADACSYHKTLVAYINERTSYLIILWAFSFLNVDQLSSKWSIIWTLTINWNFLPETYSNSLWSSKWIYEFIFSSLPLHKLFLLPIFGFGHVKKCNIVFELTLNEFMKRNIK
jgi:hypothetical protein